MTWAQAARLVVISTAVSFGAVALTRIAGVRQPAANFALVLGAQLAAMRFWGV